MTVAAEFARRIHALRYEEFPEEALRWARIGILDTFGVLLAGSTHENVAILSTALAPESGPCTVLGTAQRCGPLDAAMINGTAGHVLDYDDSHANLHGHPSVAILPALLAAAELKGSNGRELIRAYVAGFETQSRLGRGVSRYQYTHGWHPTTTIGIFGAVGACSVMLGLNTEQTTQAFSIATHMASGIKSNFGTMTKSLGVGQAARNALLAVRLAQGGFTGGTKAFEHHHGYFNVFNGEGHYDASRIFDAWASPLCIVDPGIKQKRYPCCYACLAPVDGIEALMRQHGLTADNVSRIECSVHPIRLPHINVPDPQSGLDAKFSVHYCLSKVLLDGRLTIAAFEGDAHNDPKVRALMRKVEFSAYADENPNGAKLRVHASDGRVLDIAIEKALGASYAQALPDDLVRAKFIDCAGRIVGETAALRLHAMLADLDAVADVRQLTAATVPPARRAA